MRLVDPVAVLNATTSCSHAMRRDPGHDDREGAWWLWALLAAVLIAIVLFALLSDGDDDDDAVGTALQNETEEAEVDPATHAHTAQHPTASHPPPATTPHQDP